MSGSEFNINDLSLSAAEEAESFSWLRRNDPVHWDEKNGFWLLTRHADVKYVSRSPELFSSQPHGPWHAFESHFSIQAEDGAPHHRTRNVVSRGFTPRATKHLAERVLRYTDEAIDAVGRGGRCDLVQDIAVPVPMRIIADILGLESRFDLFRRWVDSVTGTMSDPTYSVSAEDEKAAREFEEHVRFVVETRSASPGDDLISTMLSGRGEGVFESFEREPFPGVPEGDGVLGFISFLVLAGSETTRHAIAQGMRALIEHPDQRERLRANPDLLERATEEILRFVAPVRAMQRTVMRDTELGGRKIEAGSIVVMAYGSANRDEEVFDEPQRFLIDRVRNDHVSLGFGTHFCLGANLARMEIRNAVARLIERLPDLELAPGTEPTRFPSAIVNGLVHMPTVFTPISV
jgi:cytochrome P450 family 142 subfamily A polypeptide 1